MLKLSTLQLASTPQMLFPPNQYCCHRLWDCIGKRHSKESREPLMSNVPLFSTSRVDQFLSQIPFAKSVANSSKSLIQLVGTHITDKSKALRTPLKRATTIWTVQWTVLVSDDDRWWHFVNPRILLSVFSLCNSSRYISERKEQLYRYGSPTSYQSQKPTDWNDSYFGDLRSLVSITDRWYW